MTNLELKIVDDKNSPISAFAYSAGKMIEALYTDEMKRLKNENALLQGRILGYKFHKCPPELQRDYNEWFHIESKREGRI